MISFIEQVRQENLETAIEKAEIPEPAKQFMSFTFKTIQNRKPHEIASLLAYGRESEIPGLFNAIINGIQIKPAKVSTFRRFLERHIELDGDEHGPMATRLIEQLCDGDAVKLNEVMYVAINALQARLDFWDAIYLAINTEN